MENTTPKISVLMSVYNGQTFLKEAIDSILNQSFSDFEMIIVNDGSTDNSESIIKAYNDPRIVYIKNESNLGLIASLNKGLQLCRGEFIARMDADDVALPQRFLKQLTYLQKNPNVAVLSTKLSLIDESGNDEGFWNDDFETTTTEEIKAMMPKLNCIGHPTVMMRAGVVKSFGYHKKFKGSEDWGLWLTLLSQNFIIAKLDEVLLKYRIHAQGTTVKANQEDARKRIIRFKASYLQNRLFTLKFKGTDKKVVRYLLIDWLKYYFAPLYKFLVCYSGTKLSTLLQQRRAFHRLVTHFPEDSKILFFFPFCHLGGAEVVHSDIVKTAGFAKPIVFFTSNSATKTLLPQFRAVATVLEIDQLLVWPFIKRKVINQLVKLCTKHPQLKLFSSNSRFYYELLAHVPSGTEAVDLIHAFMHAHEDSAEKWSLPVVDKLKTRVIINRKTGRDFEKQYRESNVSTQLLKRILYISNFVDTQQKVERDFSSTIKIMYVGRGTAEKRVHLLAKLAFDFKQNKLPVEFHFVGDVINAIPAEYQTACIFHGEISNKQTLSRLYHQSHLLAMASTREGFPMVIMEAMMHGVVPISTNVGGIPQHIISQQNGILIEPIAPEDYSLNFTNELQALLNNRLKLKAMSEAAYDYALTHFTKEQFTGSYTNLFNNGLPAAV